jgi:hypothetical protein
VRCTGPVRLANGSACQFYSSHARSVHADLLRTRAAQVIRQLSSADPRVGSDLEFGGRFMPPSSIAIILTITISIL